MMKAENKCLELHWLFEQTKSYYFDGVYFGENKESIIKYDNPKPHPDYDFDKALDVIHKIVLNWLDKTQTYFKIENKKQYRFYQTYKEPIGFIYGQLFISDPRINNVKWEFTLLESRQNINMPLALRVSLKFDDEGRNYMGYMMSSYLKLLRHFIEYRVSFKFISDDKTLWDLPLNPTAFDELFGYFSEREDINSSFEIYYEITWKTTKQTIGYVMRNMFAIYDSILAMQDSRNNSDLLLEYYTKATKNLKKK